MRVIQVLPALYRGDAIGNTTLAIRDILKEEGYETFICTEERDRGWRRKRWISVKCPHWVRTTC